MGRKGTRYSEEDKLFYIKLVQDGMSANAIEREYGVKHDQVLQWVERFNTGGIDALRRRPQRTYTPELMLEVVQAYLAGGTSYPQLARQYNIPNNSVIFQWVIANEMDYVGATTHFNVSYGQVYAWVKKFKQGGPDALADRRGKAKEANGQLTEMELKDLEIKRLKARLAHVSTEVAVLKKLQEFERMDVQQKKNISQFKHSRKK